MASRGYGFEVLVYPTKRGQTVVFRGKGAFGLLRLGRISFRLTGIPITGAATEALQATEIIALVAAQLATL